tara:strand:- start:126 stop:734 length:609 start_codon:yes stop_codon:yes gene_type:complete
MIHVVDNFFDDPYVIRKQALKLEYYSDREGRWPGMRSHNISKEIKNYIALKSQSITQNLHLKISDRQFNCAFQFVTKDFREGIFHADDFCDYTCIIFLSPDSIDYSGTEVCDDDHPPLIVPRKMLERKVKENFYKDTKNFLKGYKYDRMRSKVNSFFDPIIKVPARFNRCLLFSGGNYHRAQKFYGKSIKDSRLTLVSFLTV